MLIFCFSGLFLFVTPQRWNTAQHALSEVQRNCLLVYFRVHTFSSKRSDIKILRSPPDTFMGCDRACGS